MSAEPSSPKPASTTVFTAISVTHQPPSAPGAARALPNATWNLLRALTIAVVGFFSTPILLRVFSPGDFAAWVLVSSVTSFLTITDIGLSSEVVRSTATARANQDPDNGFDTLKAVFIIQSCFVLCMIGLLGGVVATFPWLFRSIPPLSIGGARWALIALGLASLVQMLLNPFVAHQIGMTRLDVGAKTAIVGRVLAFAWIMVTASRGVAVVAIGVAVLTSTSFAVGAAWIYRVDLGFRLRSPFRGSDPFGPVWRFARRRLIWFIGYFAAITFDLTIIGRYAFDELVPFALSVSLAAMGAMAFESVLATLLPQLPALSGEALGHWFRSFLHFMLGLAALVVLGICGTAVVAVPLWVGTAMADRVLSLLFPMLAVVFFRLLLDGCGVFLVVRNEQRRCMWNHVIEAAIKLPIGLVLVLRFGAIGLVWAGLFGSVAGSAWALDRALPRDLARPTRDAAIPFGIVGLTVFAILVGCRNVSTSAQLTIVGVAVLVATLLTLRPSILRDLGLTRRHPAVDAQG